MSYEDELQREVARFQAMLSGQTQHNFVSELVGDQMRRRVDELRDELEASTNRRLDLRLLHRADPRRWTIPTATLGTLLTQLQSSLNHVRWALEVGPHVAGSIPTWVQRSAATEAIALAPGSFIIRLQKAEFETAAYFDKSVGVLLDLFDAAHEEELGPDIEEELSGLGREALARLERLFKKLGTEQLGAELTWRSDEHRTSTISAPEAMMLASWLAQATPTQETVKTAGVLKMADSDARRFAIDAEDGNRYEGKAAVELAHLEIEARYQAELIVVRSRFRLTDRVKETVTLVAINRAQGSTRTTE